MPEDHTRPRLLERQRDVQKSLRKLGFFETRDPAIADAVLEELKQQGATVDWRTRTIYYPWVNGFLRIDDDGVACSTPAS